MPPDLRLTSAVLAALGLWGCESFDKDEPETGDVDGDDTGLSPCLSPMPPPDEEAAVDEAPSAEAEGPPPPRRAW